jgi:hypothetical protein
MCYSRLMCEIWFWYYGYVDYVKGANIAGFVKVADAMLAQGVVKFFRYTKSLLKFRTEGFGQNKNRILLFYYICKPIIKHTMNKLLSLVLFWLFKWVLARLICLGGAIYNEIKDMSSSSDAILWLQKTPYLFSVNSITNKDHQYRRTSGQTISSFYYSSQFNKSIIGYENGLMIVSMRLTGVCWMWLISLKTTSCKHEINHFMEYEGIVYVSCDFGIVQFDLETMLFGDTIS